MIEGRSLLAIIPARSGSKRVPQKNIQTVAGKPLVAWTIEEAKKSKYIDRLILSSDDEEIIKIAKDWGCEVPFMRPKELAQDSTLTIEPVLHAMKRLPKHDYVVLLQPTSPLRQVTDIDGCIERCVQEKADSCVSVTEVDRNPYGVFSLDLLNRLQPLAIKLYILNGAVYVAKWEWLLINKTLVTHKQTLAYLMPRERSIDVDTKLDLRIAEFLKNSDVANAHSRS